MVMSIADADADGGAGCRGGGSGRGVYWLRAQSLWLQVPCKSDCHSHCMNVLLMARAAVAILLRIIESHALEDGARLHDRPSHIASG